MAAGYGELLRTPHAARLLIGTLLGRLPNATAALAVLLFARAEGGSYALAGGLSAAYGVANAVGQPLLGRAVDRFGQTWVMLPAAVTSALGMVLFAVVGLDPLLVAYAAMLIAGLFTPPLEGGLRALWPSVLRREDQVHAAYALDAVAQEVMFAVGPLLVTLSVAVWSEAAALLVINAIGVAGALWVVVSRPSRQWRSAPREAHWLGALRSPGLLVLLGSFFFIGLALGAIAVAAVAYADEHGGGVVSSGLLSALGVGALAGGIVYGGRTWPGAPERRLRLLVAALALGYLPLMLVPGVVMMTVLAGVAGVFLAPALACAFVVVDRHAPTGTVTEAFSWLVTTFVVGNAVGTAVAGPAVQLGGVAPGFAVPAAGGVAALAVLLAAQRFLLDRPRPVVRPTVPPTPDEPCAENDRNRAVEPGFRARHQA
ncbi:MFS transporter [Streptomyces antimycoticus]|uniref:MFS transporter n=2 Tax=Streptomyces violaceusniger group TaxID=2839105 RepID=A0ABD5JMP0_9ACTN|nr:MULTISPECIES: MFS transporter [Streptomyces]MEE4588918.1 MFS transporter [Streptomyces sp. DSM 41602]AJZ84961.1 MFS transporter [Streptomyces sp. AgN23]KUL44820.1 MFS transporter [Streptomyces violaceusniger]RSS49691.1 MFS transporter [Streptomyces sp. WAC05858]WJE00619.1 MFS transporter [Streptomyces antimycoticus]